MLRLRAPLLALTVLQLAAGALATTAGASERAPGAEERAEIQRLVRENLWLERRVELAQQDSFCLVLDPSQSELALTLAGVELRGYAMRDFRIGTARIAFFHREAADPWLGVVRSGGQLLPARPEIRIEIQPPPPGAKQVEPPPVPPTAEEAVPVPDPFLIVFDGGPTLEVHSPRAGPKSALLTAWHRWWIDKFSALAWAPESAVRLRVVLDPADAAALYRSLPPNPNLLVLP